MWQLSQFTLQFNVFTFRKCKFVPPPVITLPPPVIIAKFGEDGIVSFVVQNPDFESSPGSASHQPHKAVFPSVMSERAESLPPG